MFLGVRRDTSLPFGLIGEIPDLVDRSDPKDTLTETSNIAAGRKASSGREDPGVADLTGAAIADVEKLNLLNPHWSTKLEGPASAINAGSTRSNTKPEGERRQ